MVLWAGWVLTAFHAFCQVVETFIPLSISVAAVTERVVGCSAAVLLENQVNRTSKVGGKQALFLLEGSLPRSKQVISNITMSETHRP